MNARSRKTTAIALAGSVAVASAAYAIGSQTGGGTSGAATSQSFRPVRAVGARFDHRGASLAARLGVSEARLRAAFDAIWKSHQQSGDDPRTRFEKALAGALGLDQAKVHDALGKLQAKHEAAETARRDAFAKALANELGLDAANVTKALDELRPDRGARPNGPPLGRPHGPADFLDALAKKLGVDAAKLRAAIEKVRPAGPGGPHAFGGPGGPPPGGPGGPGLRRFRGGPPPGGPGGPGGPGHGRFRAGPPPGFANELATALGVKPADVTAALEKIRSQLESDMQARRDKLATELADQLGLPAQKVKDALAAEPHGPGPGP